MHSYSITECLISALSFTTEAVDATDLPTVTIHHLPALRALTAYC